MYFSYSLNIIDTKVKKIEKMPTEYRKPERLRATEEAY